MGRTSRTGTDHDWKGCADLWMIAKADRDGTAPRPKVWQTAFKGLKRDLVVFRVIVDDSGKYLAFACARDNPLEGEEPGYRAYVQFVAVHPEFSGKGLGRRIFGDLMQLLRDSTFQIAQLKVRENNVRARALYASFGWVPTDERVVNGSDMPDSIVYEVELAVARP